MARNSPLRTPYPKAYGEVSEWMEQNGYEWDGPALEIYTKKPKTVGDKMIMYSEIQVPIKKK